jgi:fructose-1,6-bisphosphatase
MTNEEIHRTMEFIIKQQESFAESMGKADRRMNRLESAFVNIFNMVTETAKAQKELTEKVNALAEAQANTDERLNILITTVERYFNDKRNGESRG